MSNEAKLLTPQEVRVLGADTFHREMLNRCLVTSCWNCANIDRETGGCSLAQGARPPLETATFGCQAWAPDIPF